MHADGGGRRADGSANSPEDDQRTIRSRPAWAMSAAARWSPGSEVSLVEVDERRRRSWCDSGEQANCSGLTAEVAAGASCGEAFNGAHRRPNGTAPDEDAAGASCLCRGAGEAAHGPLLPGCDSAGDNLSLLDSQTFLRNSLPRAPQTQQRINRARGRSRGKGRDGTLAGALLAFSMVMCLRMETVRALPPAPDHLSVKRVSDSSATITWTAVVGAEAYRLVSASSAPGPYSTFKEYYAAPDEPASNEVTIQDLIEGNMYFLKVHSGTFDGQFESVGSPIAVAIPQDAVRTAVSDVRLEAYDETFCRLAWTMPGSEVQTGPAATHFAVAYQGSGSTTSVYNQTFIGNTARVDAPFQIDAKYFFYVISRNLNYDPSDPWSQFSGKAKWTPAVEKTLVQPPGAVSGLQAIAQTLSSLTLEFTEADRALRYQTSYAEIKDDGSLGEFVVSSSGANPEVEVNGLNEGKLYRFKVQAANNHADGYESGSTIDVKVEGSPSPPELRIDTVTSNSITVSWIAPVSTHSLTYCLSWKQPPGQTELTGQQCDLISIDAVIPNLSEGTEVEIFVRAKNLYGLGPEASIKATPIQKPTGKTTSINVTLVEGQRDRTAQLVWAPVCVEAGVCADRYKVSISREGGVYEGGEDIFMQTTGNITGLVANTTYSFKVYAGNLAGFESVGFPSPTITTDAVPQPAEKPSNLMVLGVTVDSVLLAWDAPPARQKITFFRIEKSLTEGFGAAEAEVKNEGLLDPDWLPTYNATGLTMDQTYYFGVTARSSNAQGYAGVPRATISTRPTNQPTEAVENLNVVKIFPNSALLSWTALSSSEPVTKYRIHTTGNDMTELPFSEVDHLSAGATMQYEVTGLDTEIIYSFSVSARNLNIRGYEDVPKTKISNVRLMGLPQPPLNLRATSISSDSIALAWDRSSMDPIASTFQVWYRVGALAFDTHGLPELTATHLTITGLQRGLWYDFKVFAGTLAGYELHGSNDLSVAPVSQPKEVNALIITDIALESISLRWEPATFPRATSFRLEYLDQSVETTQQSYTATGLTSGAPISFTVFARNFNALGYEPKGVSVTVTPIGPPGFATTLRIVGVTTTSVTVEYDPVELVNVTKIKVQIKRYSAEHWTEFGEYQCRIDEQYLDTPPTCSTTLVIDNLVLGVLYEVRVLQRNSNAAGYLTDGAKVLVISPTLKPTRSVSNLQVTGVTTSSVFLEFDRPLGVDAPLFYKVLYSEADSGVEYMTEEVPASQKTLNVTGLSKDVSYKFAIIGRNLNLEGYTNAVRSELVFIAPFEKPSKVANISNPGVGSDRIMITWDPPTRGPVSLYKVEIANATTMMNGERVDVADLGLAPSYVEAGTTTGTSFTVIASEQVRMEIDVKLILRVSAQNLNVDGYGTPAEILAIPTSEPKNPPLDFTLESVTTNSVYLSWMPPAGYTLGDSTITRYLLEGCAENCGTNEPFPAAPDVGDMWYVMGGSEYQWQGYQWKFTGVTYWRTVASVPFTQLDYNVHQIGEYNLEPNRYYEFRVSAGNKNTIATGPIAMLRRVMPAYAPGPARKVVISNAKVTTFALNFVPPFVGNASGVADRYRIMVDDLITNTRYEYHTILETASAILTGFNPGTEYRITVYSGNLAGYDTVGAESFSTVMTRSTVCHQDCCEIAKGCTLCCGLQARSITREAVELVWSPPPNLHLLHYQVKYQAYAISNEWTLAGTFSSNKAFITGLDKTVSNYKFRVLGGSKVKNSFDTENLAAEVLLQTEKPPVEVTCEIYFVTASSVALQFSRPYRPFAVYEVKYAVQISLDSFDENAYNNTRWIDEIQDVQKGLYATYEVTGLTPDQYYQFRVVAKTPYDASYVGGIYSNVVTAKPEPQPLAVQNLRVVQVTLDLIKIAWENSIEGNTLTQVRVSWHGLGSNGTVELPASQFDFNVSGLVSNEEYSFLVQARNYNNDGYENGVSVTGVPETTPPPPLRLRLIQFYETGVELQWEANPNIPSAVFYQIQCRIEAIMENYQLSDLQNCKSGPASQGANFIKALEFDATTHFAFVGGILTGYPYDFRVCAVGTNYQGATESTCSDYITVEPGPPPQPSILAVASVTASSVTLSWAPDNSNAESWVFIPGKDQPLYDISCPGGTVEDLKAACNADGGCVGFSTTGCLKSDLGLEKTWLDYASASYSKGTCCISTGSPFGCSSAGVDLSPKPVCGCQCKGMWRKNLQYLLQMSTPPGPFANVQIDQGTGGAQTRKSKPASCASCELCPSSCVDVKGLVLNSVYQFRVYTRNLNGLGYAGASSNLVTAIPMYQPQTSVGDLALEYASESRAQLTWTGITVETVTEYRVLASEDGVEWDSIPQSSSGGFVDLERVNHADGQLQGGAGNLDTGKKYWLKIEARNLNSNGYEGAMSSNIVTAIPYEVVGPVLDLKATATTVCTNSDTCECLCCKANLCRGIGTITLTWTAPPGPITSYSIQKAELFKDGSVGKFAEVEVVNPLIAEDAPATTATVSSLLVGTDYRFKVVAGSTTFPAFLPDCTSSTPTGTLCPSTVDASPFTLPSTSVESTLKLVHVTNGTITVRWDPIFSEPVTRYQVSYGTNILQPDKQVFAEYNHIANESMQSAIGAINGPEEEKFTAGLLQEQQSYFVYVIPRNLNEGGYDSCPKTANNISATDLGDGSFKLSWTAPSHRLPILSYRVWHRPRDTGQVLAYSGRFDLITPTSPLEYTVSGLAAGNAYDFYVIPSAAPCAMIGPIVTTNLPNEIANFMPSKSNAASIEFSWSPSQSYNGYNLAQMYVMSLATFQTGHSCVSHNYTLVERISGSKTRFAFTGLQTMQQYCFRIFGENYNTQKSGPASYFAAKPMALPYAPPLNVALVAKNNIPGDSLGASVALTWTMPTIDRYVHPLAGEIWFYKVAYWKQSEVMCLQKFLDVNCKSYQEHPNTFSNTSANVTGLVPGEYYYFKVYSGNPNGFDPDGSDPLGPIQTSKLPASVSNLEIQSVTSTSVNLVWTMPTDPPPTKLKMELLEIATGKRFLEERSCVPEHSECPSAKTWTGLATASSYVFAVYTGGADDPWIPVKSSQSYTGVSSVVGSAYKSTNKPGNITKLAWSDTSLVLKFTEPEADISNGPVIDYFFQGRIGSGNWTYTSVGEVLSPSAAGQELSITAIGGVPITLGETYSFRVFTGNLFGNSSMTYLEDVLLYPRPSEVPILASESQPAGEQIPAFTLAWTPPSTGAVDGIGFEYVLEVSDDEGLTFHEDFDSPLALNTSQRTINMINKPRPERVSNGKAYISRIRPRNSNSNGDDAVPATTLLLHTTVPPGPVSSLTVEYEMESEARFEDVAEQIAFIAFEDKANVGTINGAIDSVNTSVVLAQPMENLDEGDFIKTDSDEYMEVTHIANDNLTLTVVRGASPPGLDTGAAAPAGNASHVTLAEGGINATGTVLKLATAISNLDVGEYIKSDSDEYMKVTEKDQSGKVLKVDRAANPPGLVAGSAAVVAAGSSVTLAERSFVAAVSWQAPYLASQRTFANDYDLKYDCEAAIFSLQPKFWVLSGKFTSLTQTGIAFSRSELIAALVTAGATLSASHSRFLVRVIPRNGAGVSTIENPSVEVWFSVRPKGNLQNLAIVKARDGSVDISWSFPNTTLGLIGFDILTSTDGLKFLRNKVLPSSYYDDEGVVRPTTSTTISGLPIGKNYIHVYEISESESSIAYSKIGPALIHSKLESVPDLVALSVTANSVMLRWGLAPTPLTGWELSYMSEANASMVGPILVSVQSFNVTGLATDVSYTFFVRARNVMGLGLASAVSATTMPEAAEVYNVQIVPFDAAGNLRIAWLVNESAHPATYRVRLDEENFDGHIAALRLANGSSTDLMRTISGLEANQRYRFVVESKNAHVRGFGSPAIFHYTVTAKPAGPTQVSVAFSLSDALVVKWAKSATGSTVTFFKVIAVKSISGLEIVQYHNAETLIAEVQGLDPCSRYSITVSSCNLAGCTDASALEDQKTAPGQPANLTTLSVTQESITLSWSPPSPLLPYKYKVKYREVSTNPTSTVVVDGRLVLIGPDSTFEIQYPNGWEEPSDYDEDSTTVTVSGLVPERRYQFAIHSQYENVDGAPVYIMGMPSDAPLAVTEFKVADDDHDGVSPDSLTIMWQAPQASPITHYDFYYWSLANVADKKYHKIGFFEANENEDGSGRNFKTITGLETYQEYGFEIITRNLNSAGGENKVTMTKCEQIDDDLCTTTLPIPLPQPGRVQNLRITASTADTVTLNWDPPPSADDSFLLNSYHLVSYKAVADDAYADVTWSSCPDGEDLECLRLAGYSTGAVASPVDAATTPYTGHTITISVPNVPNLDDVLYSFRIRVRNSNSDGFGPDKELKGRPNKDCEATGCKVRDLRVAAYSKRTGIPTSSVTITWNSPIEIDDDPYLIFVYKVVCTGCSSAPSGEIEDTSLSIPSYTVVTTGSVSLSVQARTARTDRTPKEYGAAVTITATPREQPAALTTPPTLSGVSPSSVSLSWDGPSSFAGEYSYKVSWRLAGTTDVFAHPIYSTSNENVIVTGLSYTQAYEFKVYSRNLNEDGFEGLGSPTLTASPRATLGPPPNFRIESITDSSVVVAWDAHPGVTNAQYLLTFASSSDHRDNETIVDDVDVFTGTKSGLGLGDIGYFGLRVRDISGWSRIDYRISRTTSKASQVRSLAATAIDADDAGLSWEPPDDLGSPAEGLSIWGYSIDVKFSAGPWTNLGTSTSLRFNHANITQRQLVYTYRVVALIQQAAEFGYVLNPGQPKEVDLFFGTAPTFVGDTPPDQETMIVLRTTTLYIPLSAYSADVEPNQLSFRSTGALPSVARLTPSVPIIDIAAKTATQNLAVDFVPDLAGSEFYLCMQAQDANGLRTEARCFTILLPLPTPKWLSPANDSAYEARVGCELSVGFVVEDRTSSDIEPGFAAEGGFIPHVVLMSVTIESSYKSSVTTSLPSGSTLFTPVSSVMNPASTQFLWRLQKGQEGFWYRLCFSTATAEAGDPQLCISVATARCQYCTKPEDSLQRVAKNWHATWTQVWSGNHFLANPDMLMTEQIVLVGPIYTVRKDEDLAHIASRYGIDLQDLLLWNPDVADLAAQQQQYVIHELQEICVVPQSCIYSGSISSSPTISHAAL